MFWWVKLAAKRKVRQFISQFWLVAGQFVHSLRQGLRQPVGERFHHDCVVVVVVRFEPAYQEI